MRFDGESLAYYNNDKVSAETFTLHLSFPLPYFGRCHYYLAVVAQKEKSGQGQSVIPPHVTFRPSCTVKSIDVGT